MKKALITGISGQDGAYLTRFLLNKGYEVVGVVRNRSQSDFRGLAYVKALEAVNIIECDLSDLNNVKQLVGQVKPAEIYHLSSQSSVGVSLNDPYPTLHFNYISTLNILEAIRVIDLGIRLFHASSSEIYGYPMTLPIKEDHFLRPVNPYGVSKASSYLATQVYRESYNLFICNGILFNHESYLRDERFFIKKVIKTAVQISLGEKENLRVGNIHVRRDFGYAPAYVEAMWLLLQQDVADDFIISSGQSLSLEEIIFYIFDRLKISHNKLILDPQLFRPADVINIYGDNTKARVELGWNYKLNFFQVLDILLEEEKVNWNLKIDITEKN